MTDEQPKRNGLAIASLVIGIIALVTSPMPIVNNGSAILAVIGAILGIIGLVKLSKAGGKKAFGIVALALNVVAFVVVLATQQMYSDAFDKALDGPQAVSTAENKAEEKSDKKDEKADHFDMKIGKSVKLEDGTVLTVDSVEPGKTFSYMDGKYTQVTVTIKNEGDDKTDYNSFNWHAVNADGNETDQEFTSDNDGLLGSGNLEPGGKVTGKIYFKGDTVKISYVSGLNDKTVASWKVSE